MSSHIFLRKITSNIRPSRKGGTQPDDYDSSDLSSNDSKTSSGGEDSEAPSRRFSSCSDTSLSDIDDRVQKAMKQKKMMKRRNPSSIKEVPRIRANKKVYPMTVTELPPEVIQVSPQPSNVFKSPEPPKVSKSPQPIQPSLYQDDITVKLIERSVISVPQVEPPPKLIELKIESNNDSINTNTNNDSLRSVTSQLASSSSSSSSHSPNPSMRKSRGTSAERARRVERSKREIQQILAQVREENEWEYMQCGLL